MNRSLLLGILALALLSLAACDFGSDELFVRRTFDYTFEATLEPWEADGTDLDDPPVEWTIERSNDRANQGEWSVRFDLDNVNDAGKIWIEAAIQNLSPFATYDVQVAFDFGSSDGEVNAWRIIAGPNLSNPETREDLTFQGSTETPGGPGQFSWTRKEFSFTTSPNQSGVLWFAIGVWGTSEFPRTYFIDDVHIELVRNE